MAIPIKLAPPTPESKEEIQHKLEAARIAHANAILAAYGLLQEMHDAQVIDLFRGLLSAGDTITTKLAIASAAPESINAARNVLSLLKILGSVDPEVLHRLASELTARAHRKEKAPGILRTVRTLVGSDMRRVVVGSVAFLQAFGRALAS